MLKFLFVLICQLLTTSVFAIEPLYPLALKLKGDTIILKQKDNVFIYPSKEEYPAITKVSREDVNGDGAKEYIIAVELTGYKDIDVNGKPYELPKAPYAGILICEQDENTLEIVKQIWVGHNSADFELTDVDKDGIKDVVAKGFELAHWRHMKIASWKGGGYALLWDKGSDDFIVSQSFGFNKKEIAQIKIGYPLHPEGGQGYEPEIWEIWSWDRNQFVKQ